MAVLDHDKKTTPTTPPETWRMFDRIAGRYDLLNRVLSFRQDVRWRNAMAEELPPGDGLAVLDLATGTADVLLRLLESDRVARGAGLDMSWNMLTHAQEKTARTKSGKPAPLLRGDATQLPVAGESFDAVSIAFGIRNVSGVSAALRDTRRVLRPGGRALILEFSLPRNPLFLRLYLFYFRHVLPRIGAAVSGDGEAYRYLNQSVEAFPYGQAFCDLMTGAGFTSVRARPLTMGIATLYVGER